MIDAILFFTPRIGLALLAGYLAYRLAVHDDEA